MLNSKNSVKFVERAWENVMKEVENGFLTINNDKSLIFKFALEFLKFYGIYNETQNEIEYKAYEKLTKKKKIVDLLIYDRAKPKYKIAFEFQFIEINAKNKDKEVEKILDVYEDIGRLNYLVQKDICFIKEAYFLCVVNKEGLINKTKKKNYKIHHGYTYDAKKFKSKVNGIKLPKKFSFKWDGIYDDNKRITIPGKFAWLKPIRIQVDLEERKKKEEERKKQEEKHKKKSNRT